MTLHDEQLRRECEAWVEKHFINNDNPLTPHGHVIELLRLCRQQQANTWREARDLSIFDESMVTPFSEMCEAKARKLEQC